MSKPRNSAIPRYNPETSSTEECDAAGSDIESAPSTVEWGAKEYWLGKMYFRYAIAQQLMGNSHADESLGELDSRVEATLREYPYTDNLKFLQDQMSPHLWRDSVDDYEEFTTCLGAVLREGSRTEQASMLDSLRRYGGESRSERLVQAATKTERGSMLDKSVTGSPQEASGWHILTLKEYGDQVGTVPKYESRTTKTFPQRHEVTLRFKELEIESAAKSKKEARQMAAMKACKALNLVAV